MLLRVFRPNSDTPPVTMRGARDKEYKASTSWMRALAPKGSALFTVFLLPVRLNKGHNSHGSDSGHVFRSSLPEFQRLFSSGISRVSGQSTRQDNVRRSSAPRLRPNCTEVFPPVGYTVLTFVSVHVPSRLWHYGSGAHKRQDGHWALTDQSSKSRAASGPVQACSRSRLATNNLAEHTPTPPSLLN